uniref:Putative secreted protein n=1 Tax=Anopheles darlingi TaxID=43151 RepID=A0A2M4DFP2_ANODA
MSTARVSVLSVCISVNVSLCLAIMIRGWTVIKSCKRETREKGNHLSKSFRTIRELRTIDCSFDFIVGSQPATKHTDP